MNNKQLPSNDSRKLTRFVAKAAGATFVLRLFYLASGFVTTLLLTRWLGAEGLGVYNYAISWILLTVIFVKFGFEEYLVREIASYQIKGEDAAARKLWRFSCAFVLIGSVFAGIIFSLVLSQIAVTTPGLHNAMWISVLMIPLLAMIGLHRGRYRANKAITKSQVPEFLIRPIILIGSLASLLLFSVTGTAAYAIAVNILATTIALTYSYWQGRTLYSLEHGDEQPGQDVRKLDWIRGAFPFVLIAGIYVINQRADRLMLGSMLDMTSVGLYSVAAQMGLVINLTLLGINQAISPLVAERHESGRQAELQQTLIRMTLIATFGSILIFAFLFFFGKVVLSVFGPKFAGAYTAMLILAGGQLVNVAAGPAGELLTMSKRVYFVGAGIVVSALVNVVLNLVLIPIYGVLGAAVATSVSMATWNILLVILAKWHLNLNSNVWATCLPTKKIR